MKKLVLTSAIAVLILGCRKDCHTSLPDCLNDKIKNNEIHGNITRYDSSKGHVYEVYGGDFSTIYDKNCEVVCTLGGFVGVIDCVNNGDTLVLSKPVVVWEE